MTKVRVLSWLSVGLLLVNTMLIVFLVMRPQRPPRHEGPRNIIIEKLGLDKEQVARYDVLIQGHRHKINEHEDKLHKLKNELYITLADSHIRSSKRDSLLNGIAEVQAEIEKIHLGHFQDIRELCRPGQIPAYNALTREITGLFGRPPMKRP